MSRLSVSAHLLSRYTWTLSFPLLRPLSGLLPPDDYTDKAKSVASANTFSPEDRHFHRGEGSTIVSFVRRKVFLLRFLGLTAKLVTSTLLCVICNRALIFMLLAETQSFFYSAFCPLISVRTSVTFVSFRFWPVLSQHFNEEDSSRPSTDDITKMGEIGGFLWRPFFIPSLKKLRFFFRLQILFLMLMQEDSAFAAKLGDLTPPYLWV